MTRPATLDHFRYSAPAWWDAFERGRHEERKRAINEAATWREADWQRGAAVAITDGVER